MTGNAFVVDEVTGRGDDDERFSDLRLAFAMFGASDRDYDEKMLSGKCKYALRLLREGL